MLGTQAPSQLYIEAHAGNYAMMRTKGDPLVNHALDSRLERESEWTRKYSTISAVHQMWQSNLEADKVQAPHENDTYTMKEKKAEIAKKAMKKSIQKETVIKWNTKVKKLTFQGDFLKLLIEEEQDVTWKSISNNIPKGVLSFALKACSNGLNTPDNLKRWGIRKTDKCGLCGQRSNLEHILNWCPVALKEGRFLWRHNSVLNLMAKLIKAGKSESLEMYADLPDLWLNGGTVPPDILVTSLRPDLVIINREEKKIELMDLTCSFEKNIDQAHIRKSDGYNDLKLDIQKEGWTVYLTPYEVGSRGQVTKRNKDSIIKVLKRNKVKTNNSKLFKDMSKISLLCSYSIFQAHSVPLWRDPPLLHP